MVVRAAATTRVRGGGILKMALRNLQFDATLSLHKTLVPGQHPKLEALHLLKKPGLERYGERDIERERERE